MSREAMMRRSAVAVVAVTVLSVGCGGSDDSSSVSAAATGAPESSEGSVESTEVTTTTVVEPTTTTVAESVADAISIEPMVDVRVGAATVFSPVTDPEPVAAGDSVRTDATGFAEIAYFDGSRTRLDVDTEFDVLELVDEVDTSLVRTRMGVGRTWHRVESLGESGEFSVETSVATAVVQGTAFSVACATEQACTFMVVEGALRIDLADGSSVELVAPAALVVDADDGPGEPVPVPFDGAFGDGWLFDNAGRDVDAGFTSAAEVYQTHGPSYGSISGTFTGTRTVTSLECVTICPDMPPVGDVADRSYTFEIDCSAGVPCVGTIDTEYNSGGGVIERATLPVEFDGTSYRWTLEYSQPNCQFDNDGDGTYETTTGRLETRIDWVMTPTEAEIVDDRWVVVAMSDLSAGGATNTVVDTGGCDGPEFSQGNTTSHDIVVTRVP